MTVPPQLPPHALQLRALPPPLPADAPTVSGELARIVTLPRRPVLDCEVRPGRRYAPEAEALIAEETARYTRPPRLTCGCRDRHVRGLPNGRILVFPAPVRPGAAPPPIVECTIEEFLADAAHDRDACRRVEVIRPGQAIDLKGIGRPCITRVNAAQAWLLRELYLYCGALGFLPVGVGKTLMAILGALALAASIDTATGVRKRARSIALLIKPDQRLHYLSHYRHLAEHWRVPSLVMDRDAPGSTIVDGAPILHVVPYSLLQHKQSTELLESLDVDGMLCDEVHCIAAVPRPGFVGSTRAGRVERYLEKRNREGRPVAFAGWSGTLINKSILDVTRLSARALGAGSPYPIPFKEAEAFASVIDPSFSPDRSSSVYEALRAAFGTPRRVTRLPATATPRERFLESMADDDDGDGIREGLRKRVVETPGVVSARAAGVMAVVSISLHERRAPRIPASVAAALRQVREDSERPDGDTIAEDYEKARVAREVGAGFYNYWRFPDIPCDCPKPRPAGWPLCDGCRLISDWYAARKAFYRELREKLLHPSAHLDSKSLCENAAERAYRDPPYDGDLPVWPAEHWSAWAAIKNRVRHVSAVRWIDDYLACDAAAWAKEYTGIVWYESVAFGEKVAQLAGIPLHTGGKDAEARIRAEDGKRSICASISSHSEGRDGLQFKFSNQLVAESPASGKGWDQLLARLAREGQESDTVRTWVYLHTPEFKDALRKARDYALFDEDVSPTASLLLAADWDFEL